MIMLSYAQATQTPVQGSNGYIIAYLIGFLCISAFIIVLLKQLKEQGIIGARHTHTQGTQSKQTVVESRLPVWPIRKWLPIVNEQVNVYPHLFLVGKTRSGKTELCKAILNTRPGQVSIIDPKATPNKWGIGVQAIGIDDSLGYGDIEQALQAVLTELQTRQQAMKQGVTAFKPLTLVIDELFTVSQFTKAARDVFLKVGVIGAELNVRMLAISQSDRVKALGIDGMGDLRHNFLFLALGNKARELYPHTKAKYPCVAQLDNGLVQFDTSKVLQYARAGISPAQVWSMPIDDDDTDTSLLETLLESGIDTDIPDTNGLKRNTNELSNDDRLIVELLERGVSANKIYDVLGGNRNKVLARIKELKQA